MHLLESNFSPKQKNHSFDQGCGFLFLGEKDLHPYSSTDHSGHDAQPFGIGVHSIWQ